MSQLRMEKTGIESLPDIPLDEEYRIRTFKPGDEAALGRVYATAMLGTGSVEEVRSRLHGHPCFDPARVFVAVSGELVVGTASAWRSIREPDVGYLHMLGVLPEHRGNNLGAVLTVATLRYAQQEGFTAQRLLTDDWRLPAIQLYLALGYDPIITDCTHPRRWRKIAKALRRPDLIQRARKVVL